jgi:ribosomal protein S18 acetylase RimI-like enzyme
MYYSRIVLVSRIDIDRLGMEDTVEEGSGEHITIRRAVPGEDEETLRHLRASVGWSTVETGLASAAGGRSVVYILEKGGQPAASGALVLRSEDLALADGETSALVSNLIVDARFQGHGLGTIMLEYLEHEAVDRGIQRVSIGVDLPNVRARSLYERHQYERFMNKLESWGEVVYLAKTLPGVQE